MSHLPPARCRHANCPGVYDECKRRLVCPECNRPYFGVVSVPDTHPHVAEWDGLTVSYLPGEMAWHHPDDEGRWLTCPESWVRPITWAEWEAACAAEDTFWERAKARYAAEQEGY